jgi:hypothetical protein
MEYCSRLACRLLAFVFFSAFLSAFREWALLSGPNGLVPAHIVPEQLPNPIHELFGYGDLQIQLVCVFGMMSAMVVFFFTRQRLICLPALAVCWLCQVGLLGCLENTFSFFVFVHS